MRYPGRLVAWSGLVALLVVLAYSQRAAEGKPESDILYHYSTAVDGAVAYLIILGVTLAIAGSHSELLALRAPRGWWRALGLAGATFVVVLVGVGLLDQVLHAGEEQGYTPPAWEPSHAGAYAANFVVIAVVAPFVEELLFRGLGFSLLVPFGRWTAIVLVGLAFGLVHGLIEGLLVLALFGAALAWLRSRTDSVFPGMLVHGAFNAFALIVAVAG